MKMKEGMNWVTPTLVVNVTKVTNHGAVVGTILKKDVKGSMLTPLYNGNDITAEMVQKYV